MAIFLCSNNKMLVSESLVSEVSLLWQDLHLCLCPQSGQRHSPKIKPLAMEGQHHVESEGCEESSQSLER
ncbi:hypothetical protein LSI01_14350 [Furfurilactobacillus siliginis]|uniref:Uncharacterized protein n=1 Tax=Furfurilactobacillus siliginis TaxID=348151 RepID=A0A510VQ99_9LACO|nr:hypothetical protein LSI01_14350 [Furfurilactobacillus siliginis]